MVGVRNVIDLPELTQLRKYVYLMNALPQRKLSFQEGIAKPVIPIRTLMMRMKIV